MTDFERGVNFCLDKIKQIRNKMDNGMLESYEVLDEVEKKIKLENGIVLKKWQYGDYEIRRYNNIMSDGFKSKNDPYELIRWEGNGDKKSCYVILFIKENKDGYYEVENVGNRPFEIPKGDVIGVWILIKDFLNAINNTNEE